jgi:dihydroflavonol-4-reductase
LHQLVTISRHLFSEGEGKMNVFITGGTGFIGSHLVKRLVREGHHLTCLVRKTSDRRLLQSLGVAMVEGDVIQRESLRRGMQGCEQVVHLAAAFNFWSPDPDIYRRTNVEGQRNVMEVALELGVPRVIDISTLGIWGNTHDRPINENSRFGDRWSGRYFQTKCEGHLLTWELYQKHGLPLVSVHPAAVTGAGDHTGFGPIMQMMKSGQYSSHLFPENRMPTIHVRDVVEVIARLLVKDGLIGEKFIVGKESPTYRELGDLMCESLGLPCLKRTMPGSLALFASYVMTRIADITKKPPLYEYEVIKMMQDDWLVDGSKVERELGLTYTPLSLAFEELATWLQEEEGQKAAAPA